jgi:glucosamine-6-phosphate deaminase
MSMHLKIVETPAAAAKWVAKEIAQLIHHKPDAVLGLCAGVAVIPVYDELIRLHHEKDLSFSEVTVFALDEYQGISRAHPESRWSFLHHHFVQHVNLAAANVHVPSSEIAATELARQCHDYQQQIIVEGGIDYQLLILRSHGCIGFNEPGAPQTCHMRRVHLDTKTREQAVPLFGDLLHVPHHAVTLGYEELLQARHISVLAFGHKRAHAVQQVMNGAVDAEWGATWLRGHLHATLVADQAAAAEL